MFNSRLEPLSLGGTGIAGISLAPVLHARWREDGSGLTPFPQDRGATPPSISATAPAAERVFSIDDTGLDPSGLELAISVRDPGAPATEGPCFRSGRLAAIPASLPGNPDGFIAIGFADPETRTVDEVNADIATAFAGGAPPFDDPNVTVTGVVIAANPNRASTWLVTVSGAYTGTVPFPLPPGVGTLFFRYSGEMSLLPGQDPFNAGQIVTAQVDAPGVVFSDAPGGNDFAAIADNMVTWFLNLFSPIVAILLRDTVSTAIGETISGNIVAAATAALGRPLLAGTTISVQGVTISGNTLTITATVGRIGPLVEVNTGGVGCLTVIGVVGLGVTAADILLR